MKRIFTILAALAGVIGAQAQNWNMIITHEDGTIDTIATSAVKNVSFTLPDQNADQVIIKELYNGGCMKDDGTSSFQFDKGFILYNNCGQQAVISNLCVGILQPYNSQGTNNWYDDDGNLSYASEGYIPATDGIWYFQAPLIIEPYSQIVIACLGAIDNTLTVSQSVNYANADYYTMYDPESGYANTYYYPTPSEVIPSSHYLKAVRIGQSNAWPLSVTSPAFFIFQTKGVSPADWASDETNITYVPGQKQTATFKVLKVPNEWVLDGIEVYSAAYDSNQKRFTSDIDAGYVTLTNKMGYTEYRNVDKESTEALTENSGLLVYNYSLGVDDSTDPSGIDAEASIKKGARIIYQDTNNSTADFHIRQKFSLRGE